MFQALFPEDGDRRPKHVRGDMERYISVYNLYAQIVGF
jgi:hypothetical protein